MIVMDKAQRELDEARALYRRRYDRGFLRQQQGDYEGGQRILERANEALRYAEAKFAKARAA